LCNNLKDLILDLALVLGGEDGSHLILRKKYQPSWVTDLLKQIDGNFQAHRVVIDRLILIVDKAYGVEVKPYIEKLNSILSGPGPLGYFFSRSRIGIVVYLSKRGEPFCDNTLADIKLMHCGMDQLSLNVLIHEITHALCWSGNRFMDEGLAFNMEYYYMGCINNLPFKIISDPNSNLHVRDFESEIIGLNDAGVYLTDDFNKMGVIYQKSFSAVECLYSFLGYKEIFCLYKSLNNIQNGSERYQFILVTYEQHKRRNEKMIDLEEVNEEILNARKYLSISKRFKFIMNEIIENGASDNLEKRILVRLIATELIIDAYRSLTIDHFKVEIFEKMLLSLPASDRATVELLHATSQVVLARLLVSTNDDEKSQYKLEYAELIESALQVGSDYAPLLIDSTIAEYFRAKETGEEIDVGQNLHVIASNDKRYEEEVFKYIDYFGLKEP
jgi:hypothetical protein